MDKVELGGERVILSPLSEIHISGIQQALSDGQLWQLPVTLLPQPDAVAGFIAEAQANHENGSEMAFAIIDKASGQVVGSTRLMKIIEAHKRLEIGYTFIAQSWQRSYVNTEAKFLLLRHVFEQLKYHRVEFYIDSRNEKSQAAVERIGGVREGVLRQQMIMAEGYIRDSVIYSIIHSEWPAVKAQLIAKIARK